MRAWELLGLDEGMQQAGSLRKDTSINAGAQKKPKQPKRVKPIEPESPFGLKTDKERTKLRTLVKASR